MRKTDRFLYSMLVLIALAIATFGDVAIRSRAAEVRVASSRAMVADMGLTDLALFTEARYTRHLSQADLHTAFQDHPLAFEHFPSGSLHAPPPHLGPHHADLAATTEVPD